MPDAGRVGVCGIEMRNAVAQVLCKGKMLVAHGLHYAPGQFQRAVGIEVRVVCQRHGLIWESVGGIVDEGFQRSLRTHGFKKRLAHEVEVDERDLLFDGHLTSQDWAQLGVTSVLWIVLPLLAGLRLVLRSEVK